MFEYWDRGNPGNSGQLSFQYWISYVYDILIACEKYLTTANLLKTLLVISNTRQPALDNWNQSKFALNMTYKRDSKNVWHTKWRIIYKTV